MDDRDKQTDDAVAVRASLPELRQIQDELWARLADETDTDIRKEILANMDRNRESMRRISEARGLAPEPDARVETARSVVVGEGEHTAVAYGAPGEEQGFEPSPAVLATQRVPRSRVRLGSRRTDTRWRLLLWCIVVSSLALTTLLMIGTGRQATDRAPENEAEVLVPPSVAEEISAVLTGMGLRDVSVVGDGSSIRIVAVAASDDARDAAVRAATAVADGLTIDAEGIDVVSSSIPLPDTTAQRTPGGLQLALDQALGESPLIFSIGQTSLSDEHRRTLDLLIPIIESDAAVQLTVVGYITAVGEDEANQEMGVARMGTVRNYLISQGISPERLVSQVFLLTGSAQPRSGLAIDRSVGIVVSE